MKTIRIILLGLVLSLAGALQAQVSVSLHIGSPPQWGPTGYGDVRYYYLPEVESYYDIQSSMFIYRGPTGWVHRERLPVRYRNYDLYSGYKVVMSDYHGTTPYTHFKDHKSKYARGYQGQPQRTIGNRPDRGYSRDPGYGRNVKMKKGNDQGKGHHQGKGKKK